MGGDGPAHRGGVMVVARGTRGTDRSPLGLAARRVGSASGAGWRLLPAVLLSVLFIFFLTRRVWPRREPAGRLAPTGRGGRCGCRAAAVAGRRGGGGGSPDAAIFRQGWWWWCHRRRREGATGGRGGRRGGPARRPVVRWSTSGKAGAGGGGAMCVCLRAVGRGVGCARLWYGAGERLGTMGVEVGGWTGGLRRTPLGDPLLCEGWSSWW